MAWQFAVSNVDNWAFKNYVNIDESMNDFVKVLEECSMTKMSKIYNIICEYKCIQDIYRFVVNRAYIMYTRLGEEELSSAC